MKEHVFIPLHCHDMQGNNSQINLKKQCSVSFMYLRSMTCIYSCCHAGAKLLIMAYKKLSEGDWSPIFLIMSDLLYIYILALQQWGESRHSQTSQQIHPRNEQTTGELQYGENPFICPSSKLCPHYPSQSSIIQQSTHISLLSLCLCQIYSNSKVELRRSHSFIYNKERKCEKSFLFIVWCVWRDGVTVVMMLDGCYFT